MQAPSPRLQKHRYASVAYSVPAVWQRACGVHMEQCATSWSFSVRGSRNRARAYSLMACSSRILEQRLDRGQHGTSTAHWPKMTLERRKSTGFQAVRGAKPVELK